MRLIIVSGLSGSGKTIALQTLEDLGFYCVDNLPLDLLPSFAKTVQARAERLKTAAVSIDARNFVDQLDTFPDLLDQLKTVDLTVEILFLQAQDETLVRRYSETRRKHPLDLEGDTGLLDAIRRERDLLQAISAHATLVIDSSQTNVHQLRELVRNRLRETQAGVLTLLFESFGYKNGVPIDADFVFDVRCLPNPYWDRKLRLLTGLDKPVKDFLDSQPTVTSLLDDVRGLLQRWLPQFDDGSRSYLTVAIGCTGGQHRSVYFAARLAEYFTDVHDPVVTRHRDLGS